MKSQCVLLLLCVCLIIWSSKAKGEISEMVQNIDYAPTFLDLAGDKKFLRIFKVYLYFLC